MNRVMPDCVEFGLRLKKLRKRLGISGRFLAREAGITSGSMTFVELGKSCPSSRTLERLADVLGVTMDELWRGIGRCEEL